MLGYGVYYIINMKKKNDIIAGIAETSKIGFAGIFAGIFCIIFSVIYTLICYVKKQE